MEKTIHGEFRRGNNAINFTVVIYEGEDESYQNYDVYYHHITSGSHCECISQVAAGLRLSDEEEDLIEFLQDLEDEEDLHAWIDFDTQEEYQIIEY